MAPQKTKNNRRNPDKLAAEFTSGQLIIGICVSVFVILVAFSLGVLIGRYEKSFDSPSEKIQVAEKKEEVSPKKSVPPSSVAKTSKNGVQTSPKRLSVPSAKNLYTSATEQGKPRTKEIKPLPAPQKKTPTATASPIRIPKLPEAAPKPTPAPKPKPKPAPAPKPEPEPVSTPAPAPTPAAASVPTPPPTPAKEPASKPAAIPTPPKETTAAVSTSTPGGWGIQLASFSGPQRVEKAEAYQRRIKERLKLNSAIVKSEDDVYYRVVLIGYKDRASAVAACAEFKKKAGFADAFVRALP